MYKTYKVTTSEATTALQEFYGVDEVHIEDPLAPRFVFTPESLLNAFTVMQKAYTDNGRSMSASKIPMIRELRAWANKYDKPGQTSLGLAEAKYIVEGYLNLLK